MINFQKILILILLLFCVNTDIYATEFFRNFYQTYKIKNTKLQQNERTIAVGLVLIKIPKYKIIDSNMIYDQIMSYSKNTPFGDKHGRSTNAHETVHDINNVLRNQYKKELKKNVNAFYAGDGYAIIVENPKLTMRDIIPYIPDVVRGYRFELYFTEQLGHWNDVPTYPIDEWSAYIAGAECAVDDNQHNINVSKSDYVSGALEFSIYCTALAMAVKNNDTEYWKNNDHFKNTIQYFLIKAEKVFSEGYDKFPSDKQDKLLNNLRYHKDSKQIRDFLLTEFQGVFVD